MQHKKILTSILLLAIFLSSGYTAFGEDDITLGQKLAGRILLQVESAGEAWYIYPTNTRRYYLGKPSNAFEVMQKLGLGVKNKDLKKIPIGISSNNDIDSDNDGLSDNLEKAIGTDVNSPDSDNDNYNDKIEVENSYNPNGDGKTNYDESLIENLKGKILIQTEDNGEAWYLDPISKKRYYLGRPADAFELMRKFGLGIKSENLAQISSGYLYSLQEDQLANKDEEKENNNNNDNEINYSDPVAVYKTAIIAIKDKDAKTALKCFVPEMKTAVEYTINFLSAEGLETLSSIMSTAELSTSTDTEKIYSKEISSSMMETTFTVEFKIKKQDTGDWLLENL